MIRGAQLWWKRGRSTLPVTFESRRRRATLIRAPHDNHSHEVLTSCLFPATDAAAWAARVAELRAAALSLEERRHLLNLNVAVSALVRELGLVLAPKRVRERTIEAVLAAARRLDVKRSVEGSLSCFPAGERVSDAEIARRDGDERRLDLDGRAGRR